MICGGSEWFMLACPPQSVESTCLHNLTNDGRDQIHKESGVAGSRLDESLRANESRLFWPRPVDPREGDRFLRLNRTVLCPGERGLSMWTCALWCRGAISAKSCRTFTFTAPIDAHTNIYFPPMIRASGTCVKYRSRAFSFSEVRTRKWRAWVERNPSISATNTTVTLSVTNI